MCQISRREAAAVKILHVINSCKTTQQLQPVQQMIQRYHVLYHDTAPLMRFYLQQMFEISHTPIFTKQVS